MQPDTQSALFREKILKSDPVHLTLKGFECVKTFFESVNVSDGKMRRFGTQAVRIIVCYIHLVIIVDFLVL